MEHVYRQRRRPIAPDEIEAMLPTLLRRVTNKGYNRDNRIRRFIHHTPTHRVSGARKSLDAGIIAKDSAMVAAVTATPVTAAFIHPLFIRTSYVCICVGAERNLHGKLKELIFAQASLDERDKEREANIRQNTLAH